MAINDKNASINELNLSYIFKLFMSSAMEPGGIIDGKITRHKLSLLLPTIKAIGASIICLFHTITYFNFLKQWLSQLNFFWLWFAHHTTSIIDTIIAVALTKHEYSTSNKLRKLRADNVFHNSRNCCNCYHTKSAKAKST